MLVEVIIMKKGVFLALFLIFIVGCTQEAIVEDKDMMLEKEGIDKSTDDKMMENAPGDDTMTDAGMIKEAMIMDVSPAEAKDLIDTKPDLVVIDVSPHYAKGHLPRAVHYYLGDGSLDAAIPSLDPEAEYLVYCHVDSVAIAGAQKLIDAGFKTVYRLEGNYGAWVDAGYPIEE